MGILDPRDHQVVFAEEIEALAEFIEITHRLEAMRGEEQLPLAVLGDEFDEFLEVDPREVGIDFVDEDNEAFIGGVEIGEKRDEFLDAAAFEVLAYRAMGID